MLDDAAKEIIDEHDLIMRGIQDDFENKMLVTFREKIGINDDEYKAVNFVSMLIYHCEKGLERICAGIIKKGVVMPLTDEMIDFMFGELTFTSKINIYEELLNKYPTSYKDLIKGISYYRQLNTIRNQIFHCKLSKILYKGKSITKGETKLLLIEDLIKSAGDKMKNKIEASIEASKKSKSAIGERSDLLYGKGSLS